jgi:cell division ATPase FtsA
MMVNTPEKRMIVGLDIGTSKVVAVVGEVDGEGTIEVVGIGSHPASGGRGRAHGGLPNSLGLCGDCR